MTVFNRRNALVGFVTLKAASRYLERRRRRERLGRLKIALLVTLGVVSAGILLGVAAAYLRSRRSELEELEETAGEVMDEIVAEADSTTAVPEPLPAT
jgi:hypothetical protein